MKNTDPFVRHIQHLQRRRNIVNVDFINVNIQHPLHFLPSSILRFIYLHSKVHYSVPLLHIHFPLLIPSFWLRSQNSKAVFFLLSLSFCHLLLPSLCHFIFSFSGGNGKKKVAAVRYRIYTENLGWISRFCVNLQRSL